MSFKAFTNTRNNNNMNKTNTKAQQQPFCKVCFDAKRDDYNTHYLKDFSGPKPIVLCPYLLALKCNYCKEQGHTVSYCEILKAKKEGEIVPSRYQQQQQQQKVPSQNGNFFILRVSADKKETVTHSSRETISEKKKSVSTTNQFALLGDDEDEWELPKYNKTRKSEIVVAAAPQEVAVVAVAAAVAVAEPEPIMEFVGTTWAKIAAAPPVTKKMTTAPVSIKEVLKKDVASLFVTRSEASTPADYEKPMPKFIHMTPVKSSSTDNNVKTEKVEKYFTAPPFTRDWADDDSSSQDDGW